MKYLAILIALTLAPLAAVHAADDNNNRPIKLIGIGPGKMLVNSVQQPGETRADKAVPSHPNALRLSHDVWMIMFGTRMFTGTDDDRSIYCQLRRGQADGPLIRERVLTLESGGWDGRGKDVRKVQGTPTGFGVPKGALINGRPAPNANVFMVKWYTYPKLRIGTQNVDPKTAHDRVKAPDAKLVDELAGQVHLESMQFRLNEAEDDIEILQEVRKLNQRGFEDAKFPCEIPLSMNHSMMPPKPVDANCDQWIELDQFGNRIFDCRLAAVLFQFNREKGLYEWVKTGPLSPPVKGGEFAPIESTLNRIGNDWIICARCYGGQGQTIWFRVKDPLKEWSEPIVRDEPGDHAHKVACVCADGVLRIFAHDRATSPRNEHRNPLYCWDVNLDDFTVSTRRLIFDSHEAGFPLKYPFVDCPKVLPAGGGRQLLGFRVLTPLKWHIIPKYPEALTPEEFDVLGGYVAELKYDGPVPDEWKFASDTANKSAASSVGVNYDEHIKPIFRQHCLSCHGDDKQQADLNLQSYATVLKGGSGGAVVVAGRSSQSLLFKAITDPDDDARMPPNRLAIPAEQIAMIQKWIDSGLREASDSKSMVVESDLSFTPAANTSAKPATPAMPGTLPEVKLPSMKRPLPVYAIDASPWAPLVAVAAQDHVRLMNLDTQSEAGRLPFPEGEPNVLRFSCDGAVLVVAGGRPVELGKVVLFDVRTGKRLATIGDEVDSVLAADLSPDQRSVALGGPGKFVKVYNTTSSRLRYKIEKHTDWIMAVAFSPDGKILATADRSGGLYLWEAESGKALTSLSEHKASIRALDWRDDSKILASVGEDGLVIWWDVKGGWPAISKANAHPPARPPGTYGKLANGVLAARFNREGHLCTAGRDHTIRLWDTTGAQIDAVFIKDAQPLCAVVSNDGSKLIGGDTSGQVHFWGLKTRK